MLSRSTNTKMTTKMTTMTRITATLAIALALSGCNSPRPTDVIRASVAEPLYHPVLGLRSGARQ